MDYPRSETKVIIGALRILVNDIQSEDGVANACIAEAAMRLEELQDRIKQLEFEKKGLQDLLDGQAVVIKELEDKLEQVKFALEVESHDNNYNKDRYKAIVNSMADALKQAQTYICQTPPHFSAPYHNETTNKIIEALAKWEEIK